jgi:hypothetical protein
MTDGGDHLFNHIYTKEQREALSLRWKKYYSNPENLQDLKIRARKRSNEMQEKKRINK